jgi:hypothetical protein
MFNRYTCAHDDWGIAFIVLSDYMKPEKSSKVVISLCITLQETKSSVTGKTAFESNEKELVDEAFRQLKISFPNIPVYSKAIINPTVSYSPTVGWQEQDTAYSITSKQDFIDFYTNFKNIFYIGTQNGNSSYNFTSMESAVTNALYALKKINHNLNRIINIRYPFELIFLVRYAMIIIIIIIIIIFLLYKLNMQ